MVNWISLAIPFIYLGVLLGTLATFSSLYRKRKASRSASLVPWFSPHIQRNVYYTLLHLDAAEEKSTKVPESVMKAALLRRATEDIHRIISVRNAKQALSTLLQRGSVGDELWQRFQRAEKEMEEELRDVVTEANSFAPNWGQVIFQSANEMALNSLVRKKMTEFTTQRRTEIEWWDKKRAAIQADFMKELDETQNLTVRASGKSSDEDAVLVEGGGPDGQHGGLKKRKSRK